MDIRPNKQNKKTNDTLELFFEEIGDDFTDDDFADDLENEEKGNPLVTAGIFLAMVVVAAILCVFIWVFTHADKENQTPVNGTEAVQDELAENSVAEMEQQAGQIESAVEDAEMIETLVQDPVSGNESMEFIENADTVTAKDVTNLRSVPSTLDADNVVAQLLNGEAIVRTGINEDTGWSRLDYNGQTVYAVTQYLTTDLSYKVSVEPSDPNRITTQDGRIIIFTDCDDDVTPKEYVNLRIEPSTSQGNSTVRCQVSNGMTIQRTGYSIDSGWSRVEYNGEVLYVVSSLITKVEVQE